MRRLLLLALGLLTLFWWVRRAFRRVGRPEPRGEASDRMVRDRVCNTFLPISRALCTSTAKGPLYFCSEKCRRTYLDSHAPQSVA